MQEPDAAAKTLALQTAYLVRQGIPYADVTAMAEDRRMLMICAFAELDDQRFDWATGRWTTATRLLPEDR